MTMEPEVEAEIDQESRICPECGAEESGYFCRSCGALLRGDDRVLCPRCRQVIPAGDFCNQCGQGLGGVALSLRQLAMAGDTFWVTDEVPEPVSNLEPSVFSSGISMELAQAELPDWLHELPVDSVPNEGQPHIYPSLEPIGRRGVGGGQAQFVTVAILFTGLLLAGMMIMVIVFLLRGGG
jgi:hypothetical protein